MAISKIGSRALEDASVAAVDIAPGTIGSTQLAGSIANAKLANSTITINGTSLALGASGSIPNLAWQSVVVSDGSTVTTMVAGRGYFIDNSSAVGLVKLPASASAGDTIAIKDYAANFGTNKLTIQRNSHKIQGSATNAELTTNRASVFLVYIDATKGWLFTNESNVAGLTAQFVTASGGTETTSGDFKIHTFTGDGNFVVSDGGNAAGSNSVDYLVVAGGGSGGGGSNPPELTDGGGGGAGGFRESHSTPVSGSYTASPLATPTAMPVSATTYPITVGGGGALSPGGSTRGSDGSNSVFSTITSAGGGAAGQCTSSPGNTGANGGSGGGAGESGSAGSGNTPPVSPPQGNNGGTSGGNGLGGGGGATAAGGNGGGQTSGDGGAGAGTLINPATGESGPGPSRYYSGGGGGGTGPGGGPSAPTYTAGTGGVGGGGDGHINQSTPVSVSSPGGPGTATANTGGGGGGGGCAGTNGGAGAGGKGIVIIRYKYQ